MNTSKDLIKAIEATYGAAYVDAMKAYVFGMIEAAHLDETAYNDLYREIVETLTDRFNRPPGAADIKPLLDDAAKGARKRRREIRRQQRTKNFLDWTRYRPNEAAELLQCSTDRVSHYADEYSYGGFIDDAPYRNREKIEAAVRDHAERSKALPSA